MAILPTSKPPLKPGPDHTSFNFTMYFRSGRRDGEKLQKDEGSTSRMNKLEIKRSGLFEIQRSHKQKYNQL
jgi:hypothetical protein